MKSAKTVLLAAALAFLISAKAAFADALKQTPSTALVVLKVGNLESTSKKIAELAGNLGLVQLKPELADPLSWFLKDALQASAGVNRNGDMVIAMIDPAVVGGNMEDVTLGLLPVSDYQAFISNYPDGKTDAGITAVHLHADPRTTYITQWGDYAAFASSQNLLLQKPTAFLDIPELSAKELSSKDIVIYANIRALRVKALPKIEQARVQMNMELNKSALLQQPTTRQAKLAKLTPLLKTAGNELLDGAKRFMLDADGATWGMSISNEGIATTSMIEFKPDSYLASLAAGAKNTDASLLNGLPDGKYLVYGGFTFDTKQLSDLVAQISAPLEKDIADLGPDYSSLGDMITLVKKAAGAASGETMGLIAPTGMLGQEAMLQVVTIHSGDAKTLFELQHKIVTLQLDIMKSLDLDENNHTTTVITPNAKTIDGISFDQFQTTMDPNAAQNPMQMQMMQMMSFLYGPAGMTAYTGIANDNTLLGAMGVNDKVIAGAITAIKTNDDPLGRQAVVKAVAEQLPSKRITAIYIPLDIWANTGLNYAKMFSMDPGVRIPDDLPPVGITISSDKSSLRCDTFVPAQLIQALTSAGMQFYVASHPSATQPSDKGGL